MILYHGSYVNNLTELKPFLSEHGEPFVYLSSNPVVALLYTVKPVPKPFSFYPYGFKGEKVVYSEYYENSFEDIYKGKKGFIYECLCDDIIENPTSIKCACVCNKPIKVSGCIEINDVYEKFMEYKKDGLFDVKPLSEVSEKELNFVYDDIRKTIEQYDLKKCPDNPMSKFVMKNFKNIWFE